jgi:predicted ester cyclase
MSEPNGAPMLPEADFELDELAVVILREGPARKAMEPAQVQRLLNEHLAYTLEATRDEKLLAAGALVSAEPDFPVTGIGFSRLPGEELAALEAADPATRAGVESFHVVRWIFPKGAVSFPAATRRNKDASRRLYEEVFGRGNLAVADEILAADAVSHGPGSPPTVGADQIKRQALVLRTAMPDLRVTLNDQLAEGDRVTSYWSGSGTHTGDVALPTGPVTATGNRISFEEIRIDRYAGGRIVESWFIPDRLTLWQQMGVLGPPAGPNVAGSESGSPSGRSGGRSDRNTP